MHSAWDPAGWERLLRQGQRSPESSWRALRASGRGRSTAARALLVLTQPHLGMGRDSSPEGTCEDTDARRDVSWSGSHRNLATRTIPSASGGPRRVLAPGRPQPPAVRPLRTCAPHQRALRAREAEADSLSRGQLGAGPPPWQRELGEDQLLRPRPPRRGRELRPGHVEVWGQTAASGSGRDAGLRCPRWERGRAGRGAGTGPRPSRAAPRRRPGGGRTAQSSRLPG